MEVHRRDPDESMHHIPPLQSTSRRGCQQAAARWQPFCFQASFSHCFPEIWAAARTATFSWCSRCWHGQWPSTSFPSCRRSRRVAWRRSFASVSTTASKKSYSTWWQRLSRSRPWDDPTISGLLSGPAGGGWTVGGVRPSREVRRWMARFCDHRPGDTASKYANSILPTPPMASRAAVEMVWVLPPG